jgi:Lrp/AsnC family leucine-responsive transcriptional regulator
VADAAPAALDAIDWAILDAVQADARVSIADLAGRVHLSPSATRDRLRRLEATGVIAGYTAVVDPVRAGRPVRASIRLRHVGHDLRRLHALIEREPAITECLHVSGDECFQLRVVAPSLDEVERVASALAALGSVTTNLVFSTLTAHRPLAPPGV